MVNTQNAATLSLKDKIILITGASRGIGAALARKIGASGAQTILLARTVGGLEETDDAIRAAGGPPALLVPIDFAKADHEYDQLGQNLFERFGRIDGFIAAAAQLGPLTPIAHCPPAEWQKTWQVNVGANYRLLRSLDLLFKQSSAANIVFLSCTAAIQPEAYWGPYGLSKNALHFLAKTYEAETQGFSIKVTLADPGPCATKLRATAFPGEEQSRLPQPDEAAEKIITQIWSGHK